MARTYKTVPALKKVDEHGRRLLGAIAVRRLRAALAEHLVGKLGEGNCCRKVVEQAGRVAGPANADAAFHVLFATANKGAHASGAVGGQSLGNADSPHRVPNAGQCLVEDVVDVSPEPDGRVPETLADGVQKATGDVRQGALRVE